MENICLGSTDAAGMYIKGILAGRGYKDFNYHWLNEHRHLLLTATNTQGAVEAYYILYKKQLFLTYAHQFEDAEDEGFGESINIEYYQMLKQSHDVIGLLVAYPNGQVYNIPLKTLHKYLNRHNRARLQKWSGEYTFSFPVKLLDRWDSKWTLVEVEEWIRSLNTPVKALFTKLKQVLFPDKPQVIV